MRSFVALAALALSGSLDLAIAGPCRPSNTVSTSATGSATETSSGATSSSTETTGPRIIKNICQNGGFHDLDPEDPNTIPNFTTEGGVEGSTTGGYKGDGSNDNNCVKFTVSSPLTKHKRAVGDTASLSQELSNLNTATAYTVRFFYFILTAPTEQNICTLEGFIGSTQFFTTFIYSTGSSAFYNTALVSTNVPSSVAPLSIRASCSSGGIAALYVDSIFMSNQVTPQNINDYRLDFGDGDIREPVSSPTTVATTQEATTQSATESATETATESVTESATGPTTDASETVT
ncbi:hypothetical protein CEP52_017544, partial [Fusarium oligoseptatum]